MSGFLLRKRTGPNMHNLHRLNRVKSTLQVLPRNEIKTTSRYVSRRHLQDQLFICATQSGCANRRRFKRQWISRPEARCVTCLQQQHKNKLILTTSPLSARHTERCQRVCTAPAGHCDAGNVDKQTEAGSKDDGSGRRPPSMNLWNRLDR
jgi:hypothetical protein